jgi:HEPN domain-containing protein
MKSRDDLVSGWMRKAGSDRAAMRASLHAGSFDTCCFHAQQVAEKSLKAFLIHCQVEFPFTHNLVRLLNLAAETDPECKPLLPAAEILTPYAVESRYDSEFWPDRQTAEEACRLAETIESFVTDRLPASPE